MKIICNKCGNMAPGNAKQCPYCGAPLSNAPIDGDKKFWERDDLQPTEPPELPASAKHAAGSVPFTPTHHKPRKRSFRLAALLAAVATAIIVLFFAIFIIKSVKDNVSLSYQTTKVETERNANGTSTKVVTKKGPNGTTTTVVTSGNIVNDERFQQMMEQMNRQMDSMAIAIMGSDPMATLEQMIGERIGQTSQMRQMPTRHVKQATGDVAKMAGRIGDRNYMLVFNFKDPQNVKGTGSQMEGNKTVGKVRLLGILVGQTLTMSIYPEGSKTPAGTISGTFNGSILQGIYMSNDGKAEEQRVLFYEQ